MKWEYKIEYVKYKKIGYPERKWTDVWTEELNKHGEHGWELIEYKTEEKREYDGTWGHVWFYLKRRIS